MALGLWCLKYQKLDVDINLSFQKLYQCMHASTYG